MDALTAGLAIIAVQLCMALAMGGIYLVDRNRAAGAQYWACAEILIAAGVAGLLYDAGAGRPWILSLSNNAIVWGAVFQLWGIRAFYGRPRGYDAWVIGGLFFVLHTLLLTQPHVPPRMALFSGTMLIMVCISFATAWRGNAGQSTLGAWLVLGSLGTMLFNNASRLTVVAMGATYLKPTTQSVAAVFVIYLIPLVGIVLYSVGLILLYFERSIKEQKHLATHDGLTGLLNRSALLAAGEREIAIALRYGRPLSVALIDIDHFKRINDQMGHQVGDTVLVDISRMLSSTCRQGDLIGRYGGEEFCIIFPGVNAFECEMLGKRLLESVRQYRYLDQHPVTVSAGFATLEAGQIPDSWNTLLKRADDQLYRAKDCGRDGFFVAYGRATPDQAEGRPAPASLSRNGSTATC